MGQEKAVVLVVVAGLCACQNTVSRREAAAEQDVRAFFMAHPEYSNSPEREGRLYRLFEDELKVPENRRLSLPGLLEQVYRQEQVLDEFEQKQ